MKRTSTLLCVSLLLFGLTAPDVALSQDWSFGIGFNAGIARLEGDLPDPNIGPMFSGHVRALPLPYLAINGELGYSILSADNHPNAALTDFETVLIPFELSAIVNFLPFGKVNPYVFVGGGGTYWNATNNGNTIIEPTTNEKQEGIDSFLKTGGGLEFRVTPNLGINLGASFRYSLTEAFDQRFTGDENDQLLDVYTGLTYYFHTGRKDRDHDLIPDELDLMPDISEDRDGYLDHDGIPEKNPNPMNASSLEAMQNNNGSASPIVIHHVIQRTESGRNVPVKAFVYSNIDLRVVATLYRPIGTANWNVVRMDDFGGNLYQGEIPGYAVTTDGFEYCVVAVDETLSGIGYSGLPSKPIQVDVSPSGKPWRIVGATVGAAAVGTASFIVLRKQN